MYYVHYNIQGEERWYWPGTSCMAGSATLSNQTAQHKSAIYTTLNHGRGDFKQQKMYISSEALEEFGEPIQL